MEQLEGKIGVKEYFAIVILMIATKLADDTPAILFEPLFNAGWMAPIINGILTVIPVYLLLRVSTKYKNKGLIEVIDHVLGKFIGYIVLLILWIIMFSALVVDTAIYTDIIGTVYFSKTPTILIYGMLMLVCAYGAKRGFAQIGSVAWAVFPYLIVSLFFALILTFRQGSSSFLFPIFGPGEWKIVKESVLRLSIYGDFLYLFIFIPFIRSIKDFKKGTWLGLLFTCIGMTTFMLSYVIFFDYKTVMELNYPYHEVIRTISAGFLTNMESFFLPFWVIASFVRFAIYLYIVAILFGRLFGIKQFEHIIPAFATVGLFIGMIPESPTFTIFNLREGILFISTPIFFTLPILIWIVAMFKGAFKHENANS